MTERSKNKKIFDKLQITLPADGMAYMFYLHYMNIILALCLPNGICYQSKHIFTTFSLLVNLCKRATLTHP